MIKYTIRDSYKTDRPKVVELEVWLEKGEDGDVRLEARDEAVSQTILLLNADDGTISLVRNMFGITTK